MSEKSVVKKEQTVSERFTNMIIKEFKSTGGLAQFTEKQRRLAQHLFVKTDMELKKLEAKRAEKNPKAKPISWPNVNMNKLALDAVHRIELGLDALIPNHLSVIPYFNKREGKYDIDLRIGYVGKDYYRRGLAVEKPMDIIYELVYSTDKFIPKKKSFNNEIESYEFEITSPFDRGEVIGGFGYIMYEDPRKNKLVIVTNQDFKKSEKAAMGDSFWKNHPTEMKYKTIVNRVTAKLSVDPDKVSASYAAVESQDEVGPVQADIDANANQEPLDVEPEKDGGSQDAEFTEDPPPSEEDPMTEEEKAEIERQEAAEAQGMTGTDGPGF